MVFDPEVGNHRAGATTVVFPSFYVINRIDQVRFYFRPALDLLVHYQSGLSKLACKNYCTIAVVNSTSISGNNWHLDFDWD